MSGLHLLTKTRTAARSVAALFTAALVTATSAVSDEIKSKDLVGIPETVRSVVPVPDVDARAWILVDHHSGWVLGEQNADQRIEPASLTKLMTSFLVFNALEKGELGLGDEVYVSKKAWKTGGSRMFIQVDTHVLVEDLLRGLIIQSGNDASVALAEHLGGTEQGFAVSMNHMAAELGMTGTHFTNSNGLPGENHYSTLRDLVKLSIALISRFPDYYKYYSQREYTYNDITQKNRNVLLLRDPSVDGIKTGYTKSAGYGLIGTAKRDDVRLLAAVTGTESKKKRADFVQSLLQYGFAAYDGLLLYPDGEAVKEVPLWMGQQGTANVGVKEAIGIVFPKGKQDLLSAALEAPEELEAPLENGMRVGEIEFKFDGEPFHKQSLYINKDYPEGPWWSKLVDSVKRLF
ncbi:MAG: D-alanyl-D-alanine carboxypeptidase family protein [Pseudomonadota bacterium]